MMLYDILCWDTAPSFYKCKSTFHLSMMEDGSAKKCKMGGTEGGVRMVHAIIPLPCFAA